MRISEGESTHNGSCIIVVIVGAVVVSDAGRRLCRLAAFGVVVDDTTFFGG